jgi:uncharacterized protein (TIGR03437 family)
MFKFLLKKGTGYPFPICNVLVPGRGRVADRAVYPLFQYTFLLCAFSIPAFLTAQDIAGAGYTVPAGVSVAPGQILTFFVDGVGTTGITATLQQGVATSAPVINVQPVFTCNPILPQTTCGSLVAVTVQIPYELTPSQPCTTVCPVVAVLTELMVTGNGNTAAIQLNPFTDQVHVLTACDIVMNPSGSVALNNNFGLPCSPIVTHASGAAVSATSPASPGEELIAWTTGLGATNPAAVTGQPAKVPLPTAQTLGINFNYTVNALATKPRPATVSGPTLAPAYSGLAPGFPGLYQINFVVPAGPPNGIAQCSLPGTYGPGSNPVISNLTVSFGASASFDGAGICVATQIPVD